MSKGITDQTIARVQRATGIMDACRKDVKQGFPCRSLSITMQDHDYARSRSKLLA